jgi:hypothetical protein
VAILAAALCACILQPFAASAGAQRPVSAAHDSISDLLLEGGSGRSLITLTGTARSYRVGDSSVTERVTNARYEIFASRVRFRLDGALLRFATRADTINGALPVAARLDFMLRPGDTLTTFARSASRPFDLSIRQTAALATAGTSTVDLESSGLGTPAVGGARVALAYPVGDLVLAVRGGAEVEPRPDGTLPVYWRGTTLRGGLALTSSFGDRSLTASLEATRSNGDSLGGRNLFPGGGSVTLQVATDLSLPSPLDPLEDEQWPVRILTFFARPFGNDRADQPNLIIPQGNLFGAVGTLLISAGDLTIAPTLELQRETSASESSSGIIQNHMSGSAWTAQTGLDVTIPIGRAFELTPQAGYTFGSVGASFAKSAVRRGRTMAQSTSFTDAIRGSWVSIQLSAGF